MEWLNYHHLLYFWAVAREGGLVPAGKLLRLSHPTLSAQIHQLEERLGEKLFTKVGRKLELTEVGREVYGYADEIFSLGRALLDSVAGRATGRPQRLVVGVVDVVPKLVVKRLLQPALELSRPVRLVCHEDTYEKLMAELALHQLDLVISDAPVPAGSSIRAFNHLLGDTAVSWFGTKALAQSARRGFPRSLDQAPVLLPLEGSVLRRSLNTWFDRIGVRPNIAAEFEDSALLKVFGSEGLGLFPAPAVMQREVTRQFGVEAVGTVDEVREQFWVITMERRIGNEAVIAIRDAARQAVFSRRST